MNAFSAWLPDSVVALNAPNDFPDFSELYFDV